MALHILLSVVKKQNKTNNPKPHSITSLQKGFPHTSVVAGKGSTGQTTVTSLVVLTSLSSQTLMGGGAEGDGFKPNVPVFLLPRLPRLIFCWLCFSVGKQKKHS